MQQRNKNLLRNWVILLIFLTLIIFVVWGFWRYQRSPFMPGGETRVFVVQKGEGGSTIAERLEKEGFIRSSLIFKIAYKLKGEKIEAGSFKLSAGMSVDEIIRALEKGSVDRWVTLIEGWRLEEIADKLNQELGIKNQEFLKVAEEGYMFPDTYLFNKEAKASDIVATMRVTFDKKYDKALKSKIKKLGLTEEEGVILASIVEREGRSDEVRQKVASILLKRLNIEMGLNADATIQYALGFQRAENSWWKRHLSREDLKVDSSYNTYIHRGLPPGPICSPSLSSLEAVAEADPSIPYLYYYHDSQGNSHYAKTLEEHNENVASNP